MSQKVGKNNNKVYRLVLTGGPCGGKTTGQVRLCTFFENIGWKVYRVPETATVLLGGGVKWTDLTEEEAFHFQENIIKTMKQIENVYFDLASTCRQNCLVICDRGLMDATAYMKEGQWDRMSSENNWNSVELRDNRYNQVIHMVSAANGAESFYGCNNNATRKEGLELARQLDKCASQAWVGHPYYDVIDNSTEFEAKVMRMIAAVCNRLGIDAGDRLHINSKKRKFLVDTLPSDMVQPQFQDFIVVHDYLVTPNSKMQARIRRRGQAVRWDSDKGCWDLDTDNRYQVTCISLNEDSLAACNKVFMYGTDQDFSNWTYTHTIRRPAIKHESPELKMQISSREYELLRAQRDSNHYTVYKKRRCFLWNNQYFQMDIYQDPCPPRCKGLILLETYTTQEGHDLMLPDFLEIAKEVTGDPKYSMHSLTKHDNPELAKEIEKEKAKDAVENNRKATLNGVGAN